MGGWTAIRAAMAGAVLAAGLLAVAPAETAAPEVSRIQVQVRNVTGGEALRLSLGDHGVSDLELLDIRPGGTIDRIAHDAVRVDGRALLVRGGETALNVNLTLGLVCAASCPAELTGEARIPEASYAFLRTKVDDAAITRSGFWALRLASN